MEDSLVRETGMISPPMVSGAKPDTGHFEEFCLNPAPFLMRCHAECGEVSSFDLAGLKTTLLVGEDAHEAVYRAPDSQLSAAQAYQFMVPVFGQGIQYGAPPAIERQQLKIQAVGLRHDRMVHYAPIIAQEVRQWIADWPDEGEDDFYEKFTELTLKTSTHCLMGADFRASMSDEFRGLYHDLEMSVDPAGLADPNQHSEMAMRRDIARARLGELIGERVVQRKAALARGEEFHDMFQHYLDATYSDGTRLTDHEIAGMVIWFMFAGHHTSGNTSSWMLVELARHPDLMAEIVVELDQLLGDSEQVSFQSLREMPLLDAFLEEVLRLHAPLVTLSRRVMKDFHYKDYVIEAGDNVMVSPYVAHRQPEIFDDPLSFNPKRTFPDGPFAYLPFGGGRHKCVGNAFALLQVKTIFAYLLRKFEFELSEPAEYYRDIMPSLILRPSDPCRLRFRRRGR
ncbi:hypothetical protein MB02_09900 [Croceicoccus estronivorus]|uniref:cytochrome P450 n=1 Tax=Croceicoccus estronivorus TaxID=1172626 RepID=UPI000836F264|nr:cytochrome P450 [Croceicoccus estronivorus]OCC23755.1 hypothetical protein MB02_09900 [Croceicoccus estronivorus]